MNLTIYPGKSLTGTAIMPGDKSISHRAALFAAMAQGQSQVDNFLISGVTSVLLEALRDLGVSWNMMGSTLRVDGVGLHGFQPSENPINCGNSATTLRLLAGALAAAGIPAVLDGSTSLRLRPMERVTKPLHSLGVPIISVSGGTAPLTLAARPASKHLSGGRIILPVASAQVKSAILLAALSADRPVVLVEPALSRDHSERMLDSMGVAIRQFIWEGKPAVEISPLGGKELLPLRMTLPGDFSAAAFLVVAALLTPGSEIHLNGIGLNPTRIGLLYSLLEMGAEIQISNERMVSGEPVADLSIRHSLLHGIMVSGERVVQMIDEFPVFAVAAAYAHGKTIVKDAQELRYKESDRIAAIGFNLQALGATVEETTDGFIVDGNGSIPGGVHINPQKDHRTAMAMLAAGLAARNPVTVEHAEIIHESFPEFADTLQTLGADLVQAGLAYE